MKMVSTSANIDTNILKQVLKLFREQLNLRAVEPDDDFFDLGGDSLMAENLVMAINEEYEWSYDVSNIIDYPTPIAFAQDLSGGITKNDLIKIVPGCSGSEPFLFMHGAYGNNYQLRYLGKKIRSRWNFFGIRAPGVVAGEKPHSSLDEMMEAYLKVAKDHCGFYPNILAGNCGGGMLALELARRIYDLTGQRMTLVLLDPPTTFYKRQQGIKRRLFSVGRLGVIYNRLLRYLTIKCGLADTKMGRTANQKWMLANIRTICGEIYPEPFPCNLLVFVGNKFMDQSFPSIQVWANDDVYLRGIPLPGLHHKIYEDNIHVIDSEIIDFVDELRTQNLYSEVS